MPSLFDMAFAVVWLGRAEIFGSGRRLLGIMGFDEECRTEGVASLIELKDCCIWMCVWRFVG